MIAIDLSGCFNVTDDGIMWLAEALKDDKHRKVIARQLIDYYLSF